MRVFFILTLAIAAVSMMSAQEGDQVLVRTSTERDTIFAEIPEPKMSIGLTGGLAFVTPEVINNQIERFNSLYNSSEEPIRRPANWGLWFAYRPKNLPTFLSLRAEMMSTTRTYSFTTNITGNGPTVIAQVPSTSTRTYTVYPFSIGTGSVLLKTLAKAEIDFVYAVGQMSERVEVPGYSDTETVYEGEGYGFRINLQQMIPIEGTVGFTMDIGYRFLLIDEFRDARGVKAKDLELNYSGMLVAAGLSYGF